jgi:MraZ protein
MAEFVGSYQHSLDVKGRLVLPAKFRELYADGAQLAPQHDASIAMWTRSEFARRRREMVNLMHDDAEELQRVRRWAAMTFEVEIDKQGRFAVPSALRQWASLEVDVLITGELDHLTLWNPTTFDELVMGVPASAKKGHA